MISSQWASVPLMIADDALAAGVAGAAGAAGGAEGGLGVVWFYIGFIALVVGFLALDLGVFHRKAHVISGREAGAWTTIWATTAMLFSGFIYLAYENHWLGLGQNVPVVGRPGEFITVDGLTAMKDFITGYVVEWSLSMDNVFVIAVIFGYFGVPRQYQHRVLFWGILGALAMRGGMIALGAVLIQRFGWITYVFGAFLIVTAVKMAFAGSEAVHPERNILVRIVRRFWAVTPDYEGQRFFTVMKNKRDRMVRAVTPMFLALVVVEFTDLIFAIDSVPAIYAITADPFLVFTSNVFAILGLRSLYFLLASMLGRFRYLKPALVAILLFVGVKMLLVHTELKISSLASLLVVVGLLVAGIAASILLPPREPEDSKPGDAKGT